MFNQNDFRMETVKNAKYIGVEMIDVSESNQMFRKPKDMNDKALKDLANSVKQDGVLQPIIVRPKQDDPKRFVLIAGERRLRASKLAGLTEIPAVIKEISESEAVKIQMVENLQRENVHPLYEAEGFRYLLDNDESLTTPELAVRFGKSETYIIQRLKLNELIFEGKRDFLANRMSLGHALLIARLTKDDQKLAIEHITKYQGGYGSVNSLQEFVERNIINDLSAAPFKTDDTELIPEAGACTVCPKRSGASKLLFADIKEKDRCMDRCCFQAKCQKFLFNKTKEVVETKPEVYFLVDYNSPDEHITEMLQAQNITPLKEYSDFSSYNKTGKKVRGLWISGTNAGKMVTIFITESARTSGKVDNDTPDGLIAKIKQRIERGRVLDNEKIYAKIIDAIKTHPTQEACEKKMVKDEEVFMWFVILDKAKWDAKAVIKKMIGVTKDTPEKLYNALKTLTNETKAYILRKVMMDQYGGLYADTDYGFIIRKIASAYGDIDIKSFEKEQEEIRVKREQRAKERIKSLRNQKAAQED